MDFDKNDAAAGALVVGALGVLLAIFIFVNRSRMTSEAYHLQIHLVDIAGIEKGIEVVYKGYKAGAVDRVSIAYTPTFHFIVNLAIKSEIQLRTGTKIVVRNKGFVGQKILELSPPTDETRGTMLVDGTLVPVVMDTDLMRKANFVLGQVEEVIKGIQGAAPGDQLKTTLTQTRSLVANLDRLTTTLQQVLEENRADLRTSMTNTKDLTGRSADALGRNKVAVDRILANIDEATSHLPALLRDAEELAADLKKHPWRLVRKGEPDEKVKVQHDHAKPEPETPRVGP